MEKPLYTQVELANLKKIASNKNDGGTALRNALPLALVALLSTPFLSGHIIPYSSLEVFSYLKSFWSLYIVYKVSVNSDGFFTSISRKEYITKVLRTLIVRPFFNGTIRLP